MSSAERARLPWLVAAKRVVAGAVGVASGLLWGLGVFVAMSSQLTTDPADDPHGFGLMFGFVFAVIGGLIATIALPFAASPPRRRKVRHIAASVYAIGIALIIVPGFF